MTADQVARRLLLASFAGWVNREQSQMIDYLREENRILQEQLRGRFRRLLSDAGVAVIQTPFRAPNANAYAARFVRSIKEESLSKLVLFGEVHLLRAITEFVDHYHLEVNHQGLGNELIEPVAEQAGTPGHVSCRERLGGLLRFYYREVA